MPRNPVPRLLRLGLALAAAVALIGGPAAAVERRWSTAATLAGVSSAPPGTATGRPDRLGPANPPTGADAGRVSRGRLGDRVQAALDTQTAALLAGDEAGFLALADPANATLLADLRRRFTVLRAMRVAGWDETLTAAPEPVSGAASTPVSGAPQQWRAGVELRYCFAVAGCAQVPVRVETRWIDPDGKPRLVSLGASPGADLGPRPWKVSDLRVAVGARVIVAATPRYANRLAPALAGAEKAAAVADRYARWGQPPGRYLVYLAGPDEWSRWYGVSQPSWVAGYAMPVSDSDTEIILNAQKIDSTEVLDTLRHEFAHVVTLAGVRRSYPARWWLVEGIAEYIRMVGRPLSAYRGLSLTRKYLHSGRWPGLVALDEPALSASTEEATGRYGVAFLAVRCLAERYGEDRMLAFFDAVVRRGGDPDAASVAEFNAPLAAVTAGCAAYTRAAVG
jgi:hypothetical protein